MPKPPSGSHERELKRYAKELQEQGWRVILTAGKIPDAIAVKEGKIYAVEIMPYIRKRAAQSRGGKMRWAPQGGFTYAMKRRNYDMYDGVLFSSYRKTELYDARRRDK